MKPHKWAKEIKAWADGAEIEQRYIGSATATYKDYIDWHKTNQPNWDMPSWEYRIKPQPKEPQYLYVWLDKDTETAEIYLDEPKGMLEDNLCKYVGKIKLETDDGA